MNTSTVKQYMSVFRFVKTKFSSILSCQVEKNLVYETEDASICYSEIMNIVHVWLIFKWIVFKIYVNFFVEGYVLLTVIQCRTKEKQKIFTVW
jgi:hypothetical protein